MVTVCPAGSASAGTASFAPSTDTLPPAAPTGFNWVMPLPRLGFKGRGTVSAMHARGIHVEAEANRAFRKPDGGLCPVLAASEVVLLSPLAGDGGKLERMEPGNTG